MASTSSSSSTDRRPQSGHQQRDTAAHAGVREWLASDDLETLTPPQELDASRAHPAAATARAAQPFSQEAHIP